MEHKQNLSTPFNDDDNDQTLARKDHLNALRSLVGNVYPNKFSRSKVTGVEDAVTAILESEAINAHVPTLVDGQRPSPEQLTTANEALNKFAVRISGRIATPPRVMGKAAFVHLSDGISRLQVYFRKEEVRAIHNDDNGPVEQGWEVFQLLDHGDFIGVDGYLFVTKTGELSVHVREFQFLAKALLPMPDKMHGIADPEIRQRQRYADLIAGSLKVEREDGELSPREVFERRSKVISQMRRFLDDHDYIEVETPMLTPKATGAAARPFKTHHNALDIDLYARIAPELYLKRLVVGGFEKVYELNRNFRNEGIDRTHNPEFTMLEIYSAYMNADGMMDLCEEMLRTSVIKATGDTVIRYGDVEADFGGPFQRLTMKQAVSHYWPAEYENLGNDAFDAAWLDDPSELYRLFRFTINMHSLIEGPRAFPQPGEGIRSSESQLRLRHKDEMWADATSQLNQLRLQNKQFSVLESANHLTILFDNIVERQIGNPTFIKDFPKPISPLSKGSPTDPNIAERFELFIAGMECANGFSELNDPAEQYERFMDQVKQRERGDEEAMVLDEDYIRALSYGMPPAAGIGIGIDRFVMLLTNRHSIRDVILFPHMRPE